MALMNIIVDTHALIWLLEDNQRLSKTARDAMLDNNVQVVVPTIVLAEIAYLFHRNRVSVNINYVLEHIYRTRNYIVYALDEMVIEHLPPELDIHDGLIVATALVFRDVLAKEVAVVTKDQMIQQCGLVQTLW